MVCTFFGHKDTPYAIEEKLLSVLVDLIENKKACDFYVGSNGNFDRIVIGCLTKLKKKYPYIKYTVVLAYMPKKESSALSEETIYPEGLENVPPRYAIDRRKKWMIDHSDCLICFVSKKYGGAYKFKAYAERKKLKIINIE